MNLVVNDCDLKWQRKRFYKHTKSLRSDHCGIPSLQKDGHTHTEGYAKAKILNDYFRSVFSQDDSSQVPSFNCAPFPNIPLIENVSGIHRILTLQKQQVQITFLPRF